MLTVKYNRGRRSEQDKFTFKKKRIRKNTQDWENACSVMVGEGFYTLDQDSLNCKITLDEDGRKSIAVITDANSDFFIIQTPESRYVISSYATDYYQSLFYTDDRQVFIESKKLFLSLF